MTIPEAEPHVAAVLAMLQAGTPANLGVALGVGPSVNPPYVALYPDPGDVEQARLSGDRSLITISFLLHCIGAGPEQALWALDKARAVMLGDPPTVAGRRTHRMTQTYGSRELDRDDGIQPALFIAMAEFRLMSQQA
ncbi:hypothetical protein [Pseudonocardia sp. N23]|uniref:hypothetical protein n=1 Tax=Pseudonocardia sp. N23 TaxID=1987376 RepID=UPI000C035158|nr:hypothetical protein [Pseudonocardia sp. N23]GAY07503.1 hypothetical protein TOK_3523 [Pseudonocardia sp. N23]